MTNMESIYRVMMKSGLCTMSKDRRTKEVEIKGKKVKFKTVSKMESNMRLTL